MKNFLFLIQFVAFLLFCNVSFAQTETFTSSGDFIVPAGVYAINVSVWGGGGGGGQQDISVMDPRGAGGGGGGGFAGGTIIVTPGSTIAIVIGTGGAGSMMNAVAGVNGMASSATHSSGSITADGGIGGTGGDLGGAGGAGGSFTGTVLDQASFAGGTGGDGNNNDGGGGGGGAGDSGGGGAGGNQLAGTGGSANGGAGGGGGNDGAGADGSAFGGGGGGAGDEGGGGGAGGDGGVILSWALTSTTSISQTDTYSTDDDFIVPAGVTSVDVDLWGGGGGGSQQQSRGAGGGGGGAFAGGTLTVSSGNTIAIVIGSGGTGTMTLNIPGDPGDSGTASSATHSSGSITANGGDGGTGAYPGGAGGGSSFTGTVADQVSFSGGAGGDGVSTQGGGGGGGAGDSETGGAGGTPTAGTGGNANGGDGGAGGSTGAGANGSARGGGGGGSGNAGGGAGDGADGFASITYTCATITLSSAEGTQAQTINNSPLTDITYTLSASITAATVAGLPTGVTSSFSSGTLTISGQPTDVGFSNYTISTTAGACLSNPSLTGFINVEVVLPVDLLSFAAEAVNEGVRLNWVTAKEFSNEKFIVEYSTDGKFFTAIGEVRGLGDSDEQQAYQFVDNKPVAGINYYRLKQMDYDGQFEYSNIETVYFDGKKVAISLYPNPTDGLLSITTSSVSPAAISIFDSKGTLLRQENFDTAASIDVNLFGLPSGAYILSIQTEGQVYQEKFMKL